MVQVDGELFFFSMILCFVYVYVYMQSMFLMCVYRDQLEHISINPFIQQDLDAWDDPNVNKLEPT